ncbi:sugar ABC transporter substrate-binding protein [Microbacterium sp.]|uniref:sugar ABC transporter substrate-binding protein n=1 Tax=Microbacterium sp. TaxID=51671 RepID=UPI003C70A76B
MSTLRRRSRWTVPAAGAALVLGLASCSSDGGGSSSGEADDDFSGLELTVWSSIPYDPYDTLQKGYFESCAADLGMTVKVETITNDTTSKLLQAASSNTLPDIALLSTDTQLPQLAEAGVLSDLGDYGITTDGLTESVAGLGTYDDTLVGLPVQLENYAMFYNKAMFAAAGIAEFPKTFDELVAVAKQLTAGDVYGTAFSGADDGSATLFFLSFLLSAGGDPADPTSEGAVAAVDLYKKLVDEGALSKEFVNWGWDAPQQWLGEKAAITISGPWNIVPGAVELDYGVAPFPTTEGGTPTVNLLGYAYGVPVQSDAKRVAAAAALVKCRSSEENQVEVAVQGGYIPALTAAQDSFVEQNPDAKTFVDAVASSWNPGTLGTDWAPLQTVYVNALQDVAVNGVSAADALAKAAQ